MSYQSTLVIYNRNIVCIRAGLKTKYVIVVSFVVTYLLVGWAGWLGLTYMQTILKN